MSNKFAFPLYHGTSDIWLDSIKKYGLGGKKMVDFFDLESMLHQVAETCRNHNLLDSLDELVLKKMIPYEKDAFTWEYNSVFVSICPDTAERYAQSNKYGSEYLSAIMRLEERIRTKGIPFQYSDDKHNDFSENLRSLSPRPIIIKIVNINEEDLIPENNSDNPSEVFKYIYSTYDEFKDDLKMFHIFMQQYNFKLNRVIPFEDITFDFI